MSEPNEANEEFNERFENVEQALKYIADSQAKSEWLRKQDEVKSRERFEQMEKLQQQTQKQLDHITSLTRIAFEDLLFQNEKIVEAGNVLSKRK